MTLDWATHLQWRPEGAPVDWRDPGLAPTPTNAPAPRLPEKWDLKDYPPRVPEPLYTYAAARFLMVALHPAQVSEAELTEFMIEMGDAGYFAATAAKAEPRLTPMCRAVMDAVGPVPKDAPGRPSTVIAQKVALDLILNTPYEPAFGQWILSQSAATTRPVLLDIVKNERHPLLVRNAVFILRCFNDPDVVPVLRDLLFKTSDKVVRNRALAALVRWRDPEIVDWLVKRIGGDDTFRVMAVWALGRIGAPAAIDPLLEAVKKAPPEFLWSAIPALGRLAETAAADRKKRILDALLGLQGTASGAKNPAGDGRLQGMVVSQDPPTARSQILADLLKCALARAGHAPSVEWVRRVGRQSGGSTGGGALRKESVHPAAVDYFNDTHDLYGEGLKKKK
jgi:hypothetical protein